MFSKLIIAVLTLGLLLTFSSAVLSSNDAPKQGLNLYESVNEDAPRFHELKAIEHDMPPFQKPADDLNAIETPTALLPPQYFCEFIDYSGGAATYYFRIPDIYGDIEMGMRFTPACDYYCTLLTAYIGLYGTYMGALPGGPPDMKVTVYPDDGFGLPDYLNPFGSVTVPGTSLPTSGLAYVPADMTPLGPLVFTDCEEFHIGVSVDNFVDGDTLALLSDDLGNPLLRSWENWAGFYNFMLYDWGIDPNFLIGVDLCCARIPFTDCYRQEYNCGVAYYWPQPDAYGDDYFNMRFSVAGPETLMAVGVAMYAPPTTGTPDLDIFVWGDDGLGFPNLADEKAKVTIPYASIAYFPAYNHVDLSALNLVMTEDFHVGWSTNGAAGDTLAGLSDDGSCGTGRSSEYWSGIWGTILGDWGVDVNFLIYADMCRDEFSNCKTLWHYCNLYYFWRLPDRYGDIGEYMKFAPVGLGCRLEKGRVLFYWPGSEAGLPLYTYNSEIQVYLADGGGGLPGTQIAGVTITPPEYVLMPAMQEVDFTATGYHPLLFDTEIWFGVESFAPDTLTGIRTISDDGSCGGYLSCEKWPGPSYGYMLDDWGVDVNFVMEIDVCCVPLPERPCHAGEQWPTAGKDFARTNASFSDLGGGLGKALTGAQATLTKAWQYNGSQVMAYSSPVVYNDTIVGYFLDNLVALDINDGSEIWKRSLDGFEIGSGTFATPTVYNFTDFGMDVTLVFTPGGDSKAFTAIKLDDGTTWWTRNFIDHNFHFMTWGISVIVDCDGVPVVIYNDDDGDIYAVNAITGALYPGWVVNPINVGGAVFRGITTDGTTLYIGTMGNVTTGDVTAVDACTGVELWKLSLVGGLQLPALDPENATQTEEFGGMIAYDEPDNVPTLFTACYYNPDNTDVAYRAAGVMYSIDAGSGNLNWAKLSVAQDYCGVAVDGAHIINNGWTPWVPGYGEFRGPMAFGKATGTRLWKNTTTNPGLGDFWLLDGVLSCEPEIYDWYIVNSRNNFLGFYNSDNGDMMFHRRWNQTTRAGHRVGTIMTDGHLIATWRNEMVCLTQSTKGDRPRLDIPIYRYDVPVEFGSPDHTLVVFDDALGNLGGAPLTIDSVRLTDTDNNTTPPPSASLNIVDPDRVDKMAAMARHYSSNSRAFVDADLEDILTEETRTGRSQAAFAIPSWIYGVTAPVDGAVIPPQGAFNDSSAYIDIVLDVDATQIPRGAHQFYAYIYNDDPDYFLDDARIDDGDDIYGVPQIRLGIIGGCLYDDVVMDFGVGAANFAHIWNATKLADGDITSIEIDGDGASFWQGAYIFATAHMGNRPPGKGPGFSARVAHFASNWSAAADADWQSILGDPNCVLGTCPPDHVTNVLLGQISDDGASYRDVYGEVVTYAFVDSVQDFCEYDTLGNCLSWDWNLIEDGAVPYNDTLTMGFHGCVEVIGAYDEPLLNNFLIHKVDLDGRYGPVPDLWMGAMLDYDVPPSNANTIAGYDQEWSVAYAYECVTADNGWGMVRIPVGCDAPPMINAISLDNDQAAHNDSSVWLDSVYTWMSTLTGLIHQPGIDPVICPPDDFDREVFFSIAGLDIPAAPDYVRVGVAVFGLPSVADASDPATYTALADAANKWCGFGRGDQNNDRKIDLVDIAYLIDHVYHGGNGPFPFYHLGDLDDNGSIDDADIVLLIDYYVNYTMGFTQNWEL